jgi:hypothetical protein
MLTVPVNGSISLVGLREGVFPKFQFMALSAAFVLLT